MIEPRAIFTFESPLKLFTLRPSQFDPMPSSENSVSHIRKRQRCAEIEPTTTPQSPPPSKRRKLERPPQHKTPSSFWDNLSRQWLTPRALREFDRRTEQLAAPLPPDRSGLGKDHSERLKRFARHGGPSLGDLRAYPEPAAAFPFIQKMSSSQSGSRNRAKSRGTSDKSSNTRKSSAYDPGFEQHLIDHGIYPHGHEYTDEDSSVYPDNWEEINERLAQPRPSLSPSCFSREAFRKFEKKNMQALTEGTVMSKAFPIITGDADIPSQENIPFGNLKDLTDGSITKAQPDFYDGSRPADLNKRIREELGPYLVPSTNKSAPYLPNFFAEGKGPTGSAPVAKRQACYDGALGARGVHELRSRVDPETAFDNNAYTITSTYHGGAGVLSIFTTHATPSSNVEVPIEYRMTQLNAFAMTGNPDTFRQGAGALRNARDWAKEKREELITAANSILPDTRSSTVESPATSILSSSTNEIAQFESDTSTDELAMIPQPEARSAHNTPTGMRSNHSSNSSWNRRKKKQAVRASKASGIGSRDSQVA